MPSLTMLFAVLLSCGCAALNRKGVAVQILCGENLLTNGSFENGTFVGGPRDPAIMELGDKSTAVNGWVVSFSTGPRPHRHLSWVRNGNHLGLPASDSTHFLFWNTTRVNDDSVYPSIDQTIPLPIGHFLLSFDVGQHPPSQNSKVVHIIAGIDNYCENAGGYGESRGFSAIVGGPDWQHQALEFTTARLEGAEETTPCFLRVGFIAEAGPIFTVPPPESEQYVSLDNVSLRRFGLGSCVAER